jgi:hypothetical protein
MNVITFVRVSGAFSFVMLAACVGDADIERSSTNGEAPAEMLSDVRVQASSDDGASITVSRDRVVDRIKGADGVVYGERFADCCTKCLCTNGTCICTDVCTDCVISTTLE